MKTLNKAQLEQIEELGNVTNREFTDLMLKHTRLVTSEHLDNLCLGEYEEDYMRNVFDINYYCIASEYGVFGYYDFYMDELGRGLAVGFY